MRRVISIVLALVLVLTLVPMAFASADNTCEKVIITFDDSSERYAVAHTYDWNHTIGTVDGIDSGNVAYITLASSKGNSLGIKLPAGWRAYEPTAIKFWFKADTAGTYNVGFGSTFGTSTTDTTNAALCSQGLTVEGTKEGAYVEVSLDGIALSDIVYMAIKGNGTIYIDNITLVCDASMKNAAYNWTTLVDWEDGTSAAVTSARAVTVSASTDVATGTVSTSAASIYAKTSGWDSQEKTNYITIELDADKIANADDIRMFVKQATSSSKDHFGVVIDDVTYWRKNVISNYWQALYVLDETFTSQADSTTVTMTSDDVKKVTAIKLSFNQNTMYGTDITADDIECAVFGSTQGSDETPNESATNEPTEPTTVVPTTVVPTTEPTTKPDVPKLVTVATDEKASIRLNALTGIRFYTTIDSEQLAEYEAEGYTVEMGTLISTKELVGDSELNLDFTGTKVDVVFTSDEFYTEGNFTGVVGSVVNIKDSNISKDFIGRGYVKLTKDGETEIFYSETVSVRSAKTIATALKADDSIYSTLTAAHKELVDKWADVE